MKLARLLRVFPMVAFFPLYAAVAQPSAAPATDSSAGAPAITPEMLGWKMEKGSIKVLDENQKGPEGGRILHIEENASMSTALKGFTAKQVGNYGISYSIKRLSAGDEWAGCVQILCSDGTAVIRPLPYQQGHPAHSEDWIKVEAEFHTPENAVDANLQIATKAGVVVELTDFKVTIMPSPKAP